MSKDEGIKRHGDDEGRPAIPEVHLVPSQNESLQVLSQAQQDGLDSSVVEIMQGNISDEMVRGAEGIIGGGVQDAVLVTILLDASPSMDVSAPIVRKCYARLIRALAESPAASSIGISRWFFDEKPVLKHGFVPITLLAEKLEGYDPQYGCGTSVYDTVFSALTSQVIFTQQTWDREKTARNIVVVMTDGGDNSSQIDPNGTKTRRLATALADEGDYILAFIGFRESSDQLLGKREAKVLAEAIGFNNVLSASSNSRDIEDAFNNLAAAIIQASDVTAIVPTGGFFT